MFLREKNRPRRSLPASVTRKASKPELYGCCHNVGYERNARGCEARQDCGDDPVECNCPKHGAAVLVEKPRQMERSHAPDQARCGGGEQKGGRGEDAAGHGA
jgi:hypothetical protein